METKECKRPSVEEKDDDDANLSQKKQKTQLDTKDDTSELKDTLGVGDMESNHHAGAEEYEEEEELGEEWTYIPEVKYEYLDHTADVQIHSWGEDLKEAFEQCANGMFGYMTEIDKVEMWDKKDIEASGHDMDSLLYSFLDESLFLMCDDPYFIVQKMCITKFDKEEFTITATAYGEDFDLQKHPQGTEVKAITYSNMQIYDGDKHEVFVIIDI